MLLCTIGMSSTESAIANGDTRTIRLYHAHTGESIEATYRVNGHYDPAVLDKLNWFLRDWRRNEATRMDPRLFDAVWETYRAAGATEPIVVLCGYRSPQTNEMLRTRSRASGVAEHSQHILGKAMDTTMPGMSMEHVREVAMRLQMGGVGYYPSTNFVHIDVGGVRSWPRMNYEQLARLFPDGKTVHIASNGKTLPGYEEARAELQARGTIDVPPPSTGTNFFAWLFGGGHSEDEREDAVAAAPAPAAPPIRLASRSRALEQAPAQETYPTATAQTERAAKPAEKADHTVLAAMVPLRGRGAHEQDPAIADTASRAPLPLPPARPVELAALTDVPLPPQRAAFVAAAPPAATSAPIVAANPPAAAPIKKASEPETAAPPSMMVPTRLANLPNLITQGTAQGLKNSVAPPAAVLAYAGGAQLEGLRAAARNKKTASAIQAAPEIQAPPPMAPARLDQSNFLAMTGAKPVAQLQSQTVLGPTITGLRQVAQNQLRIQAGALSNLALAAQPGSFRVAVNDLPTDHFVNVAGMAYAAMTRSDHVHVLVGSLASKNQ